MKWAEKEPPWDCKDCKWDTSGWFKHRCLRCEVQKIVHDRFKRRLTVLMVLLWCANVINLLSAVLERRLWG